MCLAIPGRIESIEGDQANINFGGALKTANISMVDCKVGQWAVVHAGFAIEIMDEEEALDTIKLWNEFIDSGTADVKKPN